MACGSCKSRASKKRTATKSGHYVMSSGGKLSVKPLTQTTTKPKLKL